MARPKRDFAGLKFGRLTVIGYGDKRYLGRALLVCICDCGKTVDNIWPSNLLRGKAKSCGNHVSQPKNVTHNASASYEYMVWQGIKQRCYNPSKEQYKNYGARGITMCDRWRNSFEAFYADMGKRPNNNMSIDRINNDGNYEPNNCRWATPRQQAYNRRDATWTTTTTTVDTAAVD